MGLGFNEKSKELMAPLNLLYFCKSLGSLEIIGF